MADEVDDKKQPVANPSVADNKLGLGAFIEGLKKGAYKTNAKNEPAKVQIPDNFLKELQGSNSHLKYIQQKVEEFTTGIVSTKVVIQNLEKALLTSNKEVIKQLKDNNKDNLKQLESTIKKLGDVKTSIDKIKITPPTTAVTTAGAQPVGPQQEVDTGEEALKRVETQPVAIVEIDDSVLGKLEKVLGKLSVTAKAEEKLAIKKPAGMQGGGLFDGLLDKVKDLLDFKKLFNNSLVKSFIDPLKNILFNPATGFIASLGLAIASWFDDGPFKGIKELIGKIGVQKFAKEGLEILTKKFAEWGTKLLPAVGGELVEKGLGTAIKGGLSKVALVIAKGLGKVLRFVPFLGSIIDLGSGISRMISGDIIGGLIDFAAAAAGLLDLVFPGLGRALSIGISLINVYRDLSGGGSKENAKSEANVNIKSFFSKATEWIADKIKQIFNYYFGKLGRGWESIKKGDYMRGIVTWASFSPGLFWLENVYDWLMGTPETVTQDGKKEPAQTGLLSKAWDWLKAKIADKFVSSMRGVKRGWTDFTKGDYGRAITTWASITPGLGWLEGVYKWAFGEREKEGEVPPEPGFVDKLWSKLKEGISKRFTEAKQAVIDSFETIGKGISEAWNSVTAWFSEKVAEAKEFLSKAWDSAKEFIANKWESVKTSAIELVNKPGEALQNVWDSVTGWFNTAKESVTEFIKDPTASLKEMWDAITEKIKDLVMAPVNAVKKGWSKFTSWFGGLSEEEQTTEKNIEEFNKLSGNNIKSPTTAPLPTAANAAKETKVNKVAPNTEQRKTTLIAGEPIVPGQPLSEKQIKAVESFKNKGNVEIPNDVLQQYEKQKQGITTPTTPSPMAPVTVAPKTAELPTQPKLEVKAAKEISQPQQTLPQIAKETGITKVVPTTVATEEVKNNQTLEKITGPIKPIQPLLPLQSTDSIKKVGPTNVPTAVTTPVSILKPGLIPQKPIDTLKTSVPTIRNINKITLPPAAKAPVERITPPSLVRKIDNNKLNLPTPFLKKVDANLSNIIPKPTLKDMPFSKLDLKGILPPPAPLIKNIVSPSGKAPDVTSLFKTLPTKAFELPEVATRKPKIQPIVSPITRTIKSVPTPLAPLDTPSSPSLGLMKDMKDDIADALKSKPTPGAASKGTSTVATVASNQTTAVTNSTNIYGSTLDRDIPYIERNKYRQQLMYNRNLL